MAEAEGFLYPDLVEYEDPRIVRRRELCCVEIAKRFSDPTNYDGQEAEVAIANYRDAVGSTIEDRVTESTRNSSMVQSHELAANIIPIVLHQEFSRRSHLYRIILTGMADDSDDQAKEVDNLMEMLKEDRENWYDPERLEAMILRNLKYHDVPVLTADQLAAFTRSQTNQAINGQAFFETKWSIEVAASKLAREAQQPETSRRTVLSRLADTVLKFT